MLSSEQESILGIQFYEFYQLHFFNNVQRRFPLCIEELFISIHYLFHRTPLISSRKINFTIPSLV